MSKQEAKKFRKIVESRIKGLGLDALFHQVDVTKKDEDPYTKAKIPYIQQEQQLLNKLINSPSLKEPRNIFQQLTASASRLIELKKDIRLAFDIGSSSIKVIEIRQSKTGPLLSKALYIPIPHSATTVKMKREEFILQSLSQSLDIAALKKSLVATLIPRHSLIVKFITIPTPRKEEIDDMLTFELEHHLPFSISEVEFDYHIIKQENTTTQLLVAAVKKDDIQQFLDLLSRLDIQPDVVGITAIACFNALLDSMPESGTTLQVHIGANSTDLNIVTAHTLCFSRGLQWGSKELTLQLAQSLNLDFDNAENIKKENEIILTKKEANATQLTISEVAAGWADKLIAEIKKTIQHYQLYCARTTIDRILLTGAGAQLGNLNEYIRDKLNIKTTLHKPPADIIFGCDPTTFHKYFQGLNVLLGISLKVSAANTINLNLLPRSLKTSLRRKRQKNEQLFRLTAAGALLLLIVLMPLGILELRNVSINRLNRKLKAMEPAIQEISDIKNKITTIEEYISTKQSSMEIMREISLLVTTDIIIDRFDFQRNQSVILVGTASSHSSAVNFSSSLNESQLFKDAKLKYTRKKDRLTEEIDFEIVCALN